MKSSWTAVMLMRTIVSSFVIVTALIAGCSSGGDSGGGGTPPAASPISGKFVDSTVDGLHYTSPPSNPVGGVTTNGGQYQCMPGDSVTFDLGGRTIGTPQPCGPLTTAVSVFGATSVTDPSVVNLARLLLTLGGLPNSNNVIQLPSPLPGTLPTPLPNFSDPTFATQLQTGRFPLTVSDAQAIAHLQTSFKTLSVTVVNSGTVTSNPAGINCTAAGTCSFAFVADTVVILTATGTGFPVWSGGVCAGTGPCLVTLNADAAVTATFPVAPPPATLTLLPNQGTGTGAVACSANGGAFVACAASYPSGTALVLQATANSGSTFGGWIDGTGNATGCNNTTANCSMTLTADSAVRGNFVLNTVMFSLTANTASSNGGGGSIACSTTGGAPFGACAPSYNAGTTLTLQATPNAASNFSGWGNGSGSGIGSPSACTTTTDLCTFTMTGNATLTANFNRPTFTVAVTGTGTVNSNPAGINTCTTNCLAAFNKGTPVTLTASGAGFTGWSGGGCSGTGTCQMTLTTDTTVTANFGGGGGTLTVANAPASVGGTFVSDPQATLVNTQGTIGVVVWGESDSTNLFHTENVALGFDTTTGQVLSVSFQFGDLSDGNAWVCSASLPPGCPGASVDMTTGTFTVVNTQLRAGNILTPSITLNGTLTWRITITSFSPLAAGRVGTVYSTTLAASGGTLPLSWSVISGALPAGLTLDPSTGQISGTLTTPGTSTFTIQVQDSRTPPESSQREFSLTINAGPSGGAGGTVTVVNAPASIGSTFVADPQRTTRSVLGTNATVTWSEVTFPIGPGVLHVETVGLGFDTATGQVISLQFFLTDLSSATWGCLGAFLPGCLGVSLNKTTGTLTLLNTVLTDTASSNPPPPITLNGTLSFAP